MLGLAGLFAPIVTPFTDNADSVSEVRLARLLRHLVDQGISGFVSSSETGEFITTNTGERKDVLEILLREAKGLPVIAHCTRLGTAQALDLCQHASRHGAQAAVVMPPYFGVYGDDEIEQHIRRIVNHAGLPVIVVDPSNRVGEAIKEKLSSLPGLYYASGSEASSSSRSDEFIVGDLVVSPYAQIDPQAARGPLSDLAPIGRILERYGRPRVAKAALNMRDVEVGPPRSPVLSLPRDAYIELESLVRTR